VIAIGAAIGTGVLLLTFYLGYMMGRGHELDLQSREREREQADFFRKLEQYKKKDDS